LQVSAAKFVPYS